MTTYYKIIGNNFGSFPYKLGLNTLADNNEVFNPSQECGPGGLYFCKVEHIFKWFEYGDTVCELSIPTGAQVVSVGDKFKADSIYIEQKMDLTKEETIEYLFSKGACKVWVNNNTALHMSSWLGYLPIVKFLIARGIEYENINGALQTASWTGHLPVVEYLIKHGANIHANNDYALQCACIKGYLSIVKFLVDNGANVNAYYGSVLQNATKYGHLSVVKYLVEHGANANCDLALSIACEKGYLPIVEFLLDNGARITLQYEYIIKYSPSFIIDYIIKHHIA